MLFILGIIAVPVSAHFTMGNHVPAYPFRNTHFDPHAQGLIGYVFPGGGLFTGAAPGWHTGIETYPGYQSPWPYWTGGINNPWPAQGPMGWYQLDANNYAPFGAILTSTIKAGTPFQTMWKTNSYGSTTPLKSPSDNPTIEGLEGSGGASIEHAVKGDMLLAFNVTQTEKAAWRILRPTATAINFTMAEIMVPPEFSVGLSRTKVVSSWTNNYDLVSISTRNREDYTYGPFWRRLRVYTDTVAFDSAFGGYDDVTPDVDTMDDAPPDWLFGVGSGPLWFSPWKTFGNITFMIRNPTDMSDLDTDEWYYIRVNGMTAPTIAGAYFFKFRRLYSPELGSVYFPPQNWPVVLVKGEVDPAIITGTIRYGGWNTALYGQPIALPGRVRAVGIADDPYTGKSTGRPVEARGYFDYDWKGHYEVEGVAPGVYDIYASAAGFPEIKIASNVKILKGQSYHIDGYLTPGAVIKGTVFSKCGTGEVPWDWLGWTTGYLYNIKIEMYRDLDDARTMMPGGTTSKAVTWSPIAAGITNWGDYKFFYSPTAGGSAQRRGVGPPPSSLGEVGWRVTPAKGSYTFQFGEKGFYGAPSDLVGHVPSHRDAHWVNGLAAGTYTVRAWIWGYVQTMADGVTFEPCTFTIPSIEWPGNIWVPFDIRRSNWVKKEVHFHDVPGTLLESPIGWGWTFTNAFENPTDGYAAPWRQDGAPVTIPVTIQSTYVRTLAAELLDAAGTRRGWATAYIPVTLTNGIVRIRGFKEMGNYYGWGRNYGIPAGLYTANAYMWGYVEQVHEKVSLGLCGSEIFISDHLYRGAKFNITLYSKDWQFPTVDKYWRFPYMPIWVQILDEKGKQLAPFTSQYVMPQTMQGHMNSSVALWPYRWNNAWHMIETLCGYGRTTALDWATGAYTANRMYPGVPFRHDYFGPADNAAVADAGGYADPAGATSFKYGSRAYDGSDSIALVFQYFWGYGEGYSSGSKPLSFESGVYSFNALTYGYVHKKPVMVGAQKGNVTADILIKLTQGAELDLTIRFKHQNVFRSFTRKRSQTPYPTYDTILGAIGFDAAMRIRVFNDAKKLVGEYLTSDWWWQPQFDWRMGAACAHWPTSGGLRWNWNLIPTVPSFGTYCTRQTFAANNWRLNYIPAYTNEVRVVIAGLPDMYGWLGAYSPDPAFDMGYEGNAINAPYGIDAYPNYKGAYRIEVDIVPLGTVTYGYPYWWLWRTFYPPVDGLLMGESEKYIPDNHLGPYELRYDVVVPGTYLGGESSLIFELDLRAHARGQVIGYTYCNDWRSVSWTTVQFTAADGKIFNYYTFDGMYDAWLPAGSYTMSTIFWSPAKQEGYKVYTTPIALSDGSVSVLNVFLEQSGVPIPEFPVAAIVLASALAASLFILRRRKKQ